MNLVKRLKQFGKTASDDRGAYQNYQNRIGEYYLTHFVRKFSTGKKVLDIGCAEGGVLVPFQRAGFQCAGLEYSEHRVRFAREHSPSDIRFFHGNIEEFHPDEKFDVILMLDVIEHLQRKRQALENLQAMLQPHGSLIIAFPPFKSAFGGHQQVMSSILQFIPFLHLLPEKIYRWLLEHVERKNVESHFRNYQTGLTIAEFEKLAPKAGFCIIERTFHIVRPRQAFRFGIKMRENRCPICREFLSSGAIYVLGLA
ncbi:MAG: class I SAM-dependent methyltransferase [Calditrichaeota bacterium]|nr:class I SAM-dependent methyltransferase [Calditrichota bacterium]